jgi:hypothetical protein
MEGSENKETESPMHHGDQGPVAVMISNQGKSLNVEVSTI